jgi:uncharacterized coiled-coil protein SlyX
MNYQIIDLQNKINQLNYDIANCRSLCYSTDGLVAKNMQRTICRLQDELKLTTQKLHDINKNTQPSNYSTSDYKYSWE